MLDLNLSVCGLHYRESVKFTYEREDGLVRSWIDHILCSQAISESQNVTGVGDCLKGWSLEN